MSANSAFCLVAILLVLFMRTVLLRANKRLDAGETTVGQEMKGESQASAPGIEDEEQIARREDFRFIA
jgi:predicted thioesterase